MIRSTHMMLFMKSLSFCAQINGAADLEELQCPEVFAVCLANMLQNHTLDGGITTAVSMAADAGPQSGFSQRIRRTLSFFGNPHAVAACLKNFWNASGLPIEDISEHHTYSIMVTRTLLEMCWAEILTLCLFQAYLNTSGLSAQFKQNQNDLTKHILPKLLNTPQRVYLSISVIMIRTGALEGQTCYKCFCKGM